MLLALLALLAFNDIVSVAPGRLALVPVQAPKERSRLVSEFMLMGEGAGVRCALLSANAGAKLRTGTLQGALVSTPYEQKGVLRREVDPGRYALLLDNRMDRTYTAEVWLRYHFERLDVSAPGTPRELPPRRRAVVVAISLLFLIGISTYAGRRIRRSWPRRSS